MVAASNRSASYSSAPDQSVGVVEERQHQIVAGLAVPGVHRLEAGAGDGQLGVLAVEHLDERLDQRLPAGVAVELESLDELAERQVLMGQGAERRPANAREQLTESRITGEIKSERDLGEKAAEDRLDLRPVAVGVVGAEDQALLTGVAVEQRGGQRKDEHEKGRPFLTGEAP